VTTFDDARALIAGEGTFERGTAFEPVLVPLLAGDVAPTEVEFACAVGSMVSRTDSWYGFPLLGIAVAHRLAHRPRGGGGYTATYPSGVSMLL
jgi:hypothetical protein